MTSTLSNLFKRVTSVDCSNSLQAFLTQQSIFTKSTCWSLAYLLVMLSIIKCFAKVLVKSCFEKYSVQCQCQCQSIILYSWDCRTLDGYIHHSNKKLFLWINEQNNTVSTKLSKIVISQNLFFQKLLMLKILSKHYITWSPK